MVFLRGRIARCFIIEAGQDNFSSLPRMDGRPLRAKKLLVAYAACRPALSGLDLGLVLGKQGTALEVALGNR
jgi:hypothetical protein